MAFSDPRYVFLLALVAIVTVLLPAGRGRLVWVLLASLLFASGLGVTAAVMPIVGLVAYLGGLMLSRMPDGRQRTMVMFGLILLTLTPLLFYKYWVLLLPGLVPAEIGSIFLPVGISFYSFMAIGYLIDTYIDRAGVQRSPLNFALFVSFFPHITAGPISRAGAFFEQLPMLGVFRYQMAVDGLRSILVGLFMKVVIADSLAPYVNRIYADPRAFSAVDHAMATVYFSFQVYADFAGYSLIAIGSARLLGMELMRNFDTPYLSQSLPEYWRRWHISLSSWFRDYVFVPMQFRYRRSGKWGLAGALIATFTLVGIWHGAGPQYAIFGFIHGLLVSASTLTLAKRTKFWRQLGLPMPLLNVVRTVSTFLIITLTFVLFRASNVPDALHIYGGMFAPWGTRTVSLLPMLGCALLVAGDVAVARVPMTLRMPKWLIWSSYYVATLSVLIFMVMHAQQGSAHANQFIYFKF